MRRFRKDTIFRIYLLLMCVFFVFGCVGALFGQRRFYAARLSMLEVRIVELEKRPVEHSESSVSVPSESIRPIDVARKRESERLFWVEGHGTNRKWAYIDLQFKDGFRARYYFRPFPSRGELISLHRRISHDAISHYWDPDLDSDI